MSALLYVEPAYRDRLDAAGLRSFDDLWALPWNWVEEPNQRRRGWSGATRVVIGESEPLALFVKRQENHCYRSLAHPLRGKPTFYREWRNIGVLREAGVPTLEPIAYGERVREGRYQAVLITVAFDGYVDLDELFANRGGLDEAARNAVLETLARNLLRLHRAGCRHNCLAGKHLMVRMGAEPDVRLLDLEKLKHQRAWLAAAAHDLARLIRYTPTLSLADHHHVVYEYCRGLSTGEALSLVALINHKLSRKKGARYRIADPLMSSAAA